MRENDPRDMAYAALYLAITWRTYVDADAAWRILMGDGTPPKPLTQEEIEQVRKITSSPMFWNVNKLAERMKTDRCTILQIMGHDREEEIAIKQVDKIIIRLKGVAEKCTAYSCEDCPLDAIVCGGRTLCEVLSDADVTDDGKLELSEQSKRPDLRQYMTGETDVMAFRTYKAIISELDDYVKKHPRRYRRDILGEAIITYIKKRPG